MLATTLDDSCCSSNDPGQHATGKRRWIAIIGALGNLTRDLHTWMPTNALQTSIDRSFTLSTLQIPGTHYMNMGVFLTLSSFCFGVDCCCMISRYKCSPPGNDSIIG